MMLKPKDYTRLSKDIWDVIKQNGGPLNIVPQYESGQISGAHDVTDLQKRLCFDCFQAMADQKFANKVASYVTEEQLYIALKTICPVIERKY